MQTPTRPPGRITNMRSCRKLAGKYHAPSRGAGQSGPSFVCLVHENIPAHQQICLTYTHTPRKKSTVFRKYLTGQVIESRPSPEHQIREMNKPCLILHKRCI